MNATTTNSTSTQQAEKLADQVRPQVIELEKKYKLTHAQKVIGYGAFIELLRKDYGEYYIKIHKMRGAAGERVRAFLEELAGLIVDTVNARTAA